MDAVALEELVARRAARWLDGDPPVRIDVLDRDGRTHAAIHHVRVVGPVRSRDVVVKSLRHAPQASRPALNPALGGSEDAVGVANGFRLAAAGFAGAPRDLSVVELIDVLPEQQVLVFARHDEPTLRDRSRRLQLGLPASPALRSTYERTGRWVRTYHQIEAADRPALRTTLEEVAVTMRELGEFLSRGTGARSWSVLAEEAASLSVEILPDPLPIGLRHDDCAPRNFLVSDTGFLTGIDLTARWRAPVFEDLGHFMMSMVWSPAWLATRGHLPRQGSVDDLVERFLAGYYAGPIPWGPLRWFELLMLLDRWAAWIADDPAGSSARQRTGRRVRRLLGRAEVADRARQLLELSGTGR